jgi:hypothetical protein
MKPGLPTVFSHFTSSYDPHKIITFIIVIIVAVVVAVEYCLQDSLSTFGPCFVLFLMLSFNLLRNWSILL